jgi:hypothetical protein
VKFLIDYSKFEEGIQALMLAYEKAAPAVADWVEDVYVRAGKSPETVSMADLHFLGQLFSEDGPIHPHLAQNALVHHLRRTGKSTNGLLSF